MQTDRSWSPEWTVSPGEVLVETLLEHGMTQAELARRMARPLKTISEIANGHAAITPETAIQLERALGVSADLWNGLESRYRAGLARARANEELDSMVSWARGFPVRELARAGLIEGSRDDRELVRELLQFFAVSNPDGWSQHWEEAAASYRLARSTTISKASLTAWLRWGEIEADRIETGDFDADRLRVALEHARPLSRQAIFEVARARLSELLNGAGVALVILPGLPGAPASGASRWYRGRAMIQLTVRYLVDDQFWFSVYHEAGHLLTTRRGRSVLEELEDMADSPAEAAANEFARNVLTPPESWARFVAEGRFDRRAVRVYANEISVSAGIIVGRLERDGLVRHGQLANLKVRLAPTRPSLNRATPRRARGDQ